MSSSMINFMEAYSAVHNPEAKQEFYSNRDDITEMNLSQLFDGDLVDIAEQVVQIIFEYYTVAGAKNLIYETLSEVPPIQQHKADRLIDSFQTVFRKVDEVSPIQAAQEFDKYLYLKGQQRNKSIMNSVDESHARLHRNQVVGEMANVKERLLNILEKKANKDYDGDGKVESGKDEYFGSRDKAIKKAMKKKNPASKEEALRKDDDLAGAPMEATEYNTYGSASPKMHKTQMKAMAGASDRKKQLGKADAASASNPYRNKAKAALATEEKCEPCDHDKKKKKQGYNDRLDDSLGAKNGKKSQSEKDRRDESEGEEKSKGKRKFSGDKSMDEMFSKEELDAIFEKVAQWNEEGPAFPYETKAQAKAQKDHRKGKSAKGLKTGKNAPNYETSRTSGANRTT